ncbi:MAG: glycosyltransferase [Candidatus Woesearchaeota archaeon]
MNTQINNEKKVLFINNISSVAFLLGEEIKRSGWDYDIYSPYREYMFWTDKSSIKPASRFSNYFLTNVDFKKYDIIHYSYPALINSVTARLKSWLHNKIFVLHYHGSDLRWKGLTAILRNLTAIKATCIFYATPDLEKYIKSSKTKKIFLPNPINPLKKIHCKEYENKILVFSRLEKEKGLHNLIPIIKKLKDYEFHFIDWVFDDYKIKQMLPENTRIIPKVPHKEINKLLSKYKVVLGQFSPYGVFGVSELESMSLGRPTFFNWNKEFNDFYSEPLPILDYNSENIKNLMENKKERKKLGNKQKRWVFKEHNVKKSATILLNEYENLLSNVKK